MTEQNIQTGEHLRAVENASAKGKMTSREELRIVLRRNALVILTLFGVILGFGIGFGIRPLKLSDTGLMWLGLPGEVFMRMLMLTILPLIVASIIAGTASLDPKSNGKISLIALVYYVITNAVGVLVGIVMFFCIRPDKYVNAREVSREAIKNTVKLDTQDIFADLIRNLFPDNLVTACFQKTQTSYEVSESIILRNGTNITVQEYTRTVGTAPGTNVLGLIIICSILGIATGKLGEAGRPFVVFFKATSDIIIMVLTWFVWFTPVGVASLISTSIARAVNLESTLVSLAMFVLMMLLMVLSITLLLIPTAYFLTVRKNPLVFLYTAIRPVMAGFAPASSAIAMPEILMAVEGKHEIDIRISRFVVPFGTAISRGGSGAFILMCSLFLARLDGVSLQIGQVVSIAVLAFVSTLAIPAVPSASIIAVIIILSAVSITPTNIGIIMSLEWITDRLRATANVSAILYGTILINKACKKDLSETHEFNIEI